MGRLKAKPVIPWIGGKRRLASDIIEVLPQHDCYVEVFAGGAAVLFEKEPSRVEVINDINGDLVNMYRIIQHHLEEFVRQFKWAVTSRQVYQWETMKVTDTLTDIQRAARFFYLQKLGFGGNVTGRSFGTATTSRSRMNLLRIEEDLSQAHMRLNGVFIEHLPWRSVIERYDRAHTVFYLDPPYWQTEGYGYEFEWQQYEEIVGLPDIIKGRVVVSLNAHPDILRLFKGWRRRTLNIAYTVGGGAGKQAKEVLLWAH